MRKHPKRNIRILTTLLALTVMLVACDDSDSTETRASLDVNQTISSTSSTQAPTPEHMSETERQEVETYIASVVNGPFRAYTQFPNFTSINQIPAVVYSGNGLLEDAIRRTGLTSIPRTGLQSYLQEELHPDVEIQALPESMLAYDKSTDSFTLPIEESSRNFRPFSIWLEPQAVRIGDEIQFEAYELSYEFVNSDTGREESNNPLARMVIDEVTIGFSTPAQRQDLHLIDHRPLAKTRYTLTINPYGSYNMLKKESVDGDSTYKLSAQEIFADIIAEYGKVQGLDGYNLSVRTWASSDASVVGNLIEGNFVYYLNPFPDTPYYLAAPASSDGGTFDYKLGFGFMTAEYIK